MQKTLSEYETQERMLATKLFERIPTVESYTFSTGVVAYDTIVVNKQGKRIIGEIKVRNFKADKYPDYIIQIDKVRNLVKRANKHNCSKAYYINFFREDSKPDNIEFIVFDLTPRLFEWQANRPVVEKRVMNFATCESNTNKVTKDVIMLKFDAATDMRGTFSLKNRLF